MRLGPTYLLIAVLSLATCRAQGQSPLLDMNVRIQSPETTVKAYLQALGAAGNFSFSYGRAVPAERMVAPESRELTVRQHLVKLFHKDSLTWVERGNKILILPSEKGKANTSPMQTIRGQVVDAETNAAIGGANLLLHSDGPARGTSSDANGYFRFDKVEVGRHEIQCSFVGYEPGARAILVNAGKEGILHIPLKEARYEIDELEINSRRAIAAPLNPIAVVSGRSFSAYEVENYPGSISDISRAALSFPGVVSTNDGQNHIVIRGNSPKGLAWRLEGIEIPNLNHFTEIGASGGGISVLSNNMLDRSDFLTGAFPAEYGNALSGVFDLRLRTGNNETHEKTLQMGVLGMEAMVEGPLSKKSGATYIAQYRYSTLKLVQMAGAQLESVPDFQDLSFKLYMPLNNAGVLSLFGIGGLSHEEGDTGYDMDSDMYTVGLSHALTLNERTFLKSTLGLSARTFRWEDAFEVGTPESPAQRERLSDILDQSLRGAVQVNQKLGQKHRLRGGIHAEMAWNQSYMGFTEPSYEHIYVDDEVRAATLEGHLNWNWQPHPAIQLNLGTHYTYFSLNGSQALEPRLSGRWNLNARHSLSMGFGLHSRKESMTLYLGRQRTLDGSYVQLNRDLDLSRALHYVLGHRYALGQHWCLHSELYYQYLYGIPAHPFPPYFTTMNFDYGFEGSALLNYGRGYNTGIEINLEREMYEGWSLLWNFSLYDSRYWDREGTLLHTKYNGNYSSNGVIIKEIELGKARQHVLSISSRYILNGGLRYLPINVEASADAGRTIRIWDQGFSEQWDDYFRIDLMIKFRRNRPRITSEWSLDLHNLLNRQNALSHYWDPQVQDIHYTYQNTLLPFISYRIQF